MFGFGPGLNRAIHLESLQLQLGTSWEDLYGSKSGAQKTVFCSNPQEDKKKLVTTILVASYFSTSLGGATQFLNLWFFTDLKLNLQG